MSSDDHSESTDVTTHLGKYDHSAFPLRPGGAPNMDFIRQIVEWDSKHGTQSLGPEASTTEAPRPPEPSESIEDLTNNKGANTYDLSLSSIRRQIGRLFRFLRWK